MVKKIIMGDSCMACFNQEFDVSYVRLPLV